MASHLPNFEDTLCDFKRRKSVLDGREAQKVRRLTEKNCYGYLSSNSEKMPHYLPQQKQPNRIISNSRNFSSCQHENTENNLVSPCINEFYNLNRYWLDHDFKRSFHFHEMVQNDNIQNERTRPLLLEADSDENDVDGAGTNEGLLLYPWMRTQYGIYSFIVLFHTRRRQSKTLHVDKKSKTNVFGCNAIVNVVLKKL